jgi:diadenosine tetraphosphatase ApaH/serine/threonine PP2A family protein phosphatase/Ca2+-binding EF-hand superfamily protein
MVDPCADDLGGESDTDDAAFDAWDAMEQAEELDFIDQQLRQHDMERLLMQRFPTRGSSMPSPRDAYSFWASLVQALPYDNDGFVLSPPYTLRKARALYTYLKRPDAQPLPRRCVYEVLIAACKLFEEQAATSGSLIRLAAPKTRAERLLVCGDTHGQLQDVLVIFDEHGLPAPGNAYLFNGDIADRGRNATEIFVLLLAFKLACPSVLHMNRGNHEQRDLNERPFANGGGFAWELRSKYPHDERLIDMFQHLFMQLPLASVVGEWALVIHGGLFREPGVTLDEIRGIDGCRQPPSVLETREDTLLFDALWSDPHEGDGVVASDNRGGVSIQFGKDVTKSFCERNGVQSVIRSHQLPRRKRGYEIQHDAMLLTIFSASNYGGVCGNRGGVLVFDHKGPAEVKEFYAPPLDTYRQVCELRVLDKCRGGIEGWVAAARLGAVGRAHRHRQRCIEHEIRQARTHLASEAPSLWDCVQLRHDARGNAQLHFRPRAAAPAAEQTVPVRYAPAPPRKPVGVDTGTALVIRQLTRGEQASSPGTKQHTKGEPPASPAPGQADSLLDERSAGRPPQRATPARRESSGLFRLSRLPAPRNWPGFANTYPPNGRAHSMSPRLPVSASSISVRLDDATERGHLQRAMTNQEIGGKTGGTRLRRHSLVSVPLRQSLADKTSGEDASGMRSRTSGHESGGGGRRAFAPGAQRRVDRVVYYEEKDMLQQVDDDILSAMRMVICRAKNSLTAAFVAAERRVSKAAREAADGAEVGDESEPAVQRERHVLPHDVWESVLSATFPEYGALWPSYGPRLLQTSADAPATAGRRRPVHYMLWLDRFQVRLAYGRFGDFERGVMQRLYSALLAKTKHMSASQLLSYFDPRDDGTLRQREVQAALAGLDLGLSVRQLRQLVYDLGFTDPQREAEPVEVLQALLAAVRPAVAQASLGKDCDGAVGADVANGIGAAGAAPEGLGPEAQGDAQAAVAEPGGTATMRMAASRLAELREAMRACTAQVRAAFSGGSLVDVFKLADADGDGFLSADEATCALLELQRVCGVPASGPDEAAAVVAHIDLASTGRITFLDFVAAFGLPSGDGTAAPVGGLQAVAAGPRMPAAAEVRSSLSLKMMQGILTALYERTPGMQKAFRHLDEAGAGWIGERDFEQALEVVLTHRRPQGGEDGGEDVFDKEQLHELVLSLRGSNLADDAGRIDYCAFIQSFNVVDTLDAI